MSLGIIINNLSESQKAYYLLKNSADSKRPIIIFYQNLAVPCYNVLCPTMQSSETYGFNSPLVATCLSTAEDLINLPTNQNKYFYIWDLEWTRTIYHSEYLYNILRGDLKLICRSQDHADLIEKTFNTKIDRIIKDFNPEQICQLN